MTGRFPVMTPEYESVNVPGLFFAGIQVCFACARSGHIGPASRECFARRSCLMGSSPLAPVADRFLMAAAPQPQHSLRHSADLISALSRHSLRLDLTNDKCPQGHGKDYKKSAGGFIHGFRYTARALVRMQVVSKPFVTSKQLRQSCDSWPEAGRGEGDRARASVK